MTTSQHIPYASVIVAVSVLGRQITLSRIASGVSSTPRFPVFQGIRHKDDM